MQVTGTIRSVFATQEGGYQGPSGYVYTFDMEIDTSQGIISGQIGSKKQPYPLAVGQPITADVTQTDRGPRLKKINPQYANQPSGEVTPTRLNANTQAIIDQASGGQPATAGGQIMDHMAGPTSPTDSSTKYPAPPIPALQAQQEYEAKERKKAVGMCMHGYIVAEINRRPITEVWDDKDAVQAAWKLANICVDGMGQVVDGETSF